MRYLIIYLACAGLFFLSNCGIKSSKEGENKIIKEFLDTANSSKYSKAATLLVHSDKLNLHIKSSSGFIETNETKLPTSPDQPFHIASIGKMFTTVLIFQFIEKGNLSLDTSVKEILGSEIVQKLFEYEGIDYSDKVTVSHLLSHTSGVADYFESMDKNSKSLINEITKNPTKFWTPEELLNFSRENQKAVSAPGAKFHYSDTGFILLGLILEKIAGKSFENLLHEKLFNPLKMKNSSVHLRSEPSNKSRLPISPMMLADKDVTTFKSISSDWSGGGIISTTEDLLLFHKALINGELINNETYTSLKGTNEFMSGIFYGKGLMNVIFGKMSMFMPNTPDLHGHSGLLGNLLFYSPDYDTHIIINLGSTEDVGKSFELMFWIMQSVKEIHNLKN